MLEDTYSNFDRFILRTPLKPLKVAFKALNLKDYDIKDVVNDVVFLEALFIASSEFYNIVLNYKGLSVKKKEKLLSSILKYLIRSSTRCTPFGLFSGCSIGTFSKKTITANCSRSNRITRLDMNLLISISEYILKDHEEKKLIEYYPNTSLYKTNSEYRYVEYSYLGEDRKYTLERLSYNKYLEDIIKFSEEGKTFKEIVQFLEKSILKHDNIINSVKILRFINQLIDYQILVSELEPTITGLDYLDKILNILKKTKSKYYSPLLNIQNKLKKIDLIADNNVESYNNIISEIKNLGLEFNSKHIFQTDSIFTFKKNTLSFESVSGLLNALSFINKICPAKESEYLEKFKAEFLKKYENQEIPLAVILDNETGLMFDKNPFNEFSLIENLTLDPINEKANFNNLNPSYNFFQKKLEQIISKKKFQLELFDKDLNDLEVYSNNHYPDTFSAIIEIFKENGQEIIFIGSAGGSTAANLIARFSQQDKNIESLLTEITTKEKELNKDKIIAEIVHLPQNRTGNILKSKVNREYEIVYLANTDRKRNKILIKDITISIKNDKIVLRSKKLNKEILPILSNAHNYGLDPLPVYKFLSHLQGQNNNSNFNFYWEPIFHNHSFLPRVVYKNFIFSKARWLISRDELNTGKNLQKWRKERNIPQYVQIENFDNLLLINFESKHSFQTLLEYLNKRKQISIIEYLFNTKNGLKIDNEIFSNEYIISYYNNQNGN